MMTMKKRMLALGLALAIVVGLGGQAWAEVLPAVASPSPEVSTQPEESATPEVSETPTESETPEEIAAPAESETPEESTVPQEDETDETPVETPILDEPYVLPGVENFAVTEVMPLTATDDELAGHVIQNTISPSNVQIDLFNYTTDINSQSDFHFIYDGEGEQGTSINAWTGKSSDRQGGPLDNIVKAMLEDGYPVLTAGKQYDQTITEAPWPWGDPTIETHYTMEHSLAYLFDRTQVAGKQSYFDVKGLLQVDENGLMSYDSQKNFAEYRANTNSFVLYDTAAVNADNSVADQQNGQFFPFDSGNEVFSVEWNGELTSPVTSSNHGGLDHHFGMHMTAYFMQPNGGKTTSGEDMVFTFSGDDDVWVFIDGVLIGDVGGCHDRLELTINFASGAVQVINGASYDGSTVFTDTTIRAMVEAAGAGGRIQLEGNSLADGTYHTLDFFYLERGGGNSNLRLTTNLVEIPSSSVIKVDQLGNAIPGVEFELYATDETYQVSGDPIARGRTNQDGNLVLTDANTGVPLNFAELANQSKTHYVLRESTSPVGYRPTADIQLRYEELGEHRQGVLLTNNAWETGSWAASTLTMSLPTSTTIQGVNGGITYSLNEDGTSKLFAVVLKRSIVGGTPSANDRWHSVTGDILNGWQLSENAITDAGEIPEHAKSYFTWDPTTKSYDLEINPLPGDITKYYYMLGTNGKAQTQYTVGYYIEQDGQVYRIDGDNFPRQYAVNAYVTNVKNLLHVQKVDDAGTPLANATFALYQETDITVLADGTYTVTGEAYDTVITADSGNLMNVQGFASFPSAGKTLSNGVYYLVESQAPQGYVRNNRAVKVIVDNTGIYADAGTEKDGVQVMAGVGSLVDSMAQFGTGTAEGLDRTLVDIKAVVATGTLSGDSVTWNQSAGDTPGTDLLYLSRSEEAALQYAATSGVAEQNGQDRFMTDTGWIRVNAIYQNYDERGVTSTNKTALNGENVNNLFTHTTIVQVENERTGLTIAKTVEGGTVTSEGVAGVAYRFLVEKLSDGAVDANFHSTVQVKVGETTTMGEFQNGVLTVERNGVGDIQILMLQNGDYRVTEVTNDLGDVTIGDVTNHWKNVTYQAGNAVTLSDAQPSAKVTAINHYVAYKTLTVTKTVDGNMGDTTKNFTFILEVKNGGIPYKGDLTAVKSGTGVTGSGEEVLTNGGSFTLTHDQQMAIQVPYGDKVTVTERTDTGYTTNSCRYVTGTTAPPYTENTVAQTVTMTDNYTVAYQNVLDMAPPSGVDMPNTGILVMLGVGAASAVAIFGCSFLMWRRRRRDWM